MDVKLVLGGGGQMALVYGRAGGCIQIALRAWWDGNDSGWEAGGG